MAATIKHYRTGVEGRVPTAGNVEVGTIAINYHDGKLFYKNSSNAIAEISGSGGGSTLNDTTDDNGWLEFARDVTSASGVLLKIKNNTATKFEVRYDGKLNLAEVSDKGTAREGGFVYDGDDLWIGVK